MQKFFVALVLVTLFTSLLPTWAQEDGEICVAYNGNEICGEPEAVALVIQALSGQAASTPQTNEMVTSDSWTITFTDVAHLDRGDGTTYYGDVSNWVWNTPQPEIWPMFPNVDNPEADFVASIGFEYGEDESEFCGDEDDICDVTVPAGHYRLITGDWAIEGIGECASSEEQPLGCALLLVNVGEVTASYESAELNNVFTVTGRFWHGGFLNEAIVALLSHAANNMLNLDSTLNPGGTNAGANCSVRDGCQGVHLFFAITSGNPAMVKGETVVSR